MGGCAQSGKADRMLHQVQAAGAVIQTSISWPYAAETMAVVDVKENEVAQVKMSGQVEPCNPNP